MAQICEYCWPLVRRDTEKIKALEEELKKREDVESQALKWKRAAVAHQGARAELEVQVGILKGQVEAWKDRYYKVIRGDSGY